MGGRARRAALAVLVLLSLVLGLPLPGPASAAQRSPAAGTDIPPGHITSPQTWTVAGSPYRLLGTVIIDAGVTVRAQAGVTVTPAAGATLYVDGTLAAEGTAGSEVRINSTGPQWGGIQFNSSSSQSWLNHTHITGALDALVLRGAAVSVGNSTISGIRRGVDAELSRLLLERSMVTAGRGQDATSTSNGTAGGTALMISRSGVAGSRGGQSIVGNSSFHGGDGGSNWFADRRAGDGGAGVVVRWSQSVSVVNASTLGGRGGNNSGTASSYASARGGDGGPGAIIDGSNTTTLFRGGSVRGGGGGPTTSPSPSRAGDGGSAVVVGPNRSHNSTMFSFDAYAGDGGHAAGSGVHPGNGGPAILIIKGDDNLISSVRSYGGRGGDGAPLNGDGANGGHGLHVIHARRLFYYVVSLQGGRGGDTRIASPEPAGEGGDGVRMDYAETLFTELGYLIGGRGGDNHHPAGTGGGRGGTGVRYLAGNYRLETGEADLAAGEGGDNYNATNGRAGDSADAAVNVTGGTGVLVEFSRIIAAKGGRDLTGGPDGRGSDGIRIMADGTRFLVAAVDGIPGVTPACARVTSATRVEFSGNAFFRCDVGILVETPAGGRVANLTSRGDYTFQTGTGVQVRSGSEGWFTDINIDNSTDAGVQVDEGSRPLFDGAEIHSSSLTNHSIRVTGGSRPEFRKTDIRNSRIHDYHVSGDSVLTLRDSRHVYGKGAVLDTSSMWAKNLLEFKTVDARWSPAPRGFVEVFDNGTRIWAGQIFKGGGCGPGGIPCRMTLTDRVHRASGMWENTTKITNVYKNWTWRAVPGPIDDINMSTPHFEWLVGSGIAPPRWNWTEPPDGALDVPAGSRIQVSFTAPMNTTSVESALKMTAPAIGQYAWSQDLKTVEFSALPWLMPDTTYTVNISGSIAKDTLGLYFDGNRDGENQGSPFDDFDFSFTTGPRPTLRLLGNGTIPVNGNVSQGEAYVPFLIADYIAQGAPLLADTVELAMYGDATEADVASVSLWRDANGNARWDLADENLGWSKFVLGRAKFNTSTPVAPQKVEHFFVVLNISQDALIDAKVGVEISSESSLAVTGANVSMPVKPLRSGLARIVGDLLPPQVSAFGPTGVLPVDTTLYMQFTEPMNWTATMASFVLTPAQPFKVDRSGNTLIIDPIEDLQPGTNYSLRVLGSGARDRAGNLLDGNRNGISQGSPNDDFSFSFSTQVPATASVRGRVLDDLGKPLAGAAVKVRVTRNNATFSNTTGSTGEYSIQVSVTAPSTVEVSAALQDHQGNSSLLPTLDPGTVRWANLTLPELVGTLRVTVREGSGSASAGAVVELLGLARTAQTDSSGVAVFSRVPVGNYTVRALKSGFAEASAQVEVEFRRTADLEIRFESPPDHTLLAAIGAAVVAAVAALVALMVLRKRRGRKKRLERLPAKREEEKPRSAASKAAARAAEKGGPMALATSDVTPGRIMASPSSRVMERPPERGDMTSLARSAMGARPGRRRRTRTGERIATAVAPRGWFNHAPGIK